MKICYPHPLLPEREPGSHFWQTPETDILLKPGSVQEVNISIVTCGGGIRELSLEIPSGTEFKRLEYLTQSGEEERIPAGLHFSFDPPAITGRNFRGYPSTMKITAESGMPSGNFSFPLVLCYRNLDSEKNSSEHFPFSDTLQCNTGTSFKVDIVG